ncbi:outer membrane beta-barrel family protein [Microbacter margulisiae]|uniref:Outer membrane protein beta-barrel domain-containing protein n=1 Tax=Microbacter margulisiae TaxID=1350067 RepID=A0A7W5DRH8_9PORP|nr:outer membrane beta-barrel family protein [Microbacter margulisiae]MBB3187403.1 hypothetical protein [Microbacter margulisiae]
MKQILWILCCLVVSEYIQAGVTLTGKVMEHNHQPLDYFNVEVLSPKDSSLVSGGTFLNGQFQFNNLKTQSYLLKITSMGYKDYLQPVTLTNEINTLPDVVLQTKEMNEVTVTARLPVIQSTADRTIVTVEGSILGNTINGMDMLLKTPGLIKDAQGNIIVAGKGIPVFYIDGKETHSMDEVKMLNPQDIKTIEIIDNPSAAYDAQGNAVVLIKTIRYKQDQLRLGEAFRQARFFSNDEFVEGVITKGIITTDFYYGYSPDNSKVYESGYATIAENNFMNTSKIANVYSQSQEGRLSIDLALSKKQFLTIEGNGYYDPYYIDESKLLTFTSPLYNNFTTYSHNSNRIYQLNGNLTYTFLMDTIGQTLNVIADFTKQKTIYKQNFYNTLIGSKNITPYWNTNDDSNAPMIYSLNVDYEKPMHNIFTLETGVRYYLITTNSHTDLTGSNSLMQSYYTNEQNISAYGSITAKFTKKLNASVGLRAENLYRKAQNNTQVYIDSVKLNFFPSFAINYTSSNKFSIGFSYSERITRPSFSALDPSLQIDSLMNKHGTPSLQSTLTHSAEVSAKLFGNITLHVGYEYNIHPIYFLVYQDHNTPTITDIRFINGRNTNDFYLYGLFDQSLFKWWSISASGTLWTNNYLYYNNNLLLRNNNTPNFYGNLLNIFSLPYSLTFNIALQYRSDGSSDAIYQRHFCNSEISLNRSFLNHSLLIDLSVNNILKETTIWQQSVLNGNNIDISRNDNRYVKLSITYRIGKSTYQYHSKSADQTEQQRIK